MVVPASALKARHWVYLDDQRTHEVHALVHPRAPDDILLNMTEFPAGSRDAAEALVDERALSTQAQLELAMRELEERLALSGTYFRADMENMQWALVAPPPAARRLDLRAHEVALPGGSSGAKMGFHHFHGERRDALLISVPREDLPTRSILAELEFTFPDADAGELRVIHPRLSTGTLRASLARQHVELPTRGFAKLIEATDYERAFGPSWLERTRQTFQLAAARVLSFGREPTLEPAPLAREDKPRIPTAALEQAVLSPRVLALRAKFIDGDELERVLEGGELAIRRFMQQKRKRFDHHTAYDLSMLESTLLVEYGLRSGQQIFLDEEGAKLVRFIQGIGAGARA